MTTPGLSPRRREVALVVLGGAAFVASISISVVNVVLADLARELRATTADLQWIVNGYTLVYAVFMLAASTIGDRFGLRRVFRVGLVLCLVAAAAAAFSPTTTALIAARAAMGLGAAIVSPTSLAIAAQLSDTPREQARAFAVWAGVGALGLALGPIIGGALLERFWWGSAFLAGMPALLLILGATWVVIPASPPQRRGRLDWSGLVLATAGLALAVAAIIQGPSSGWTDPSVLGMALAGTVLLVAFVRCELRIDDPMLDVSYIRRRAVALPALGFAAITFAFAGMLLGVSLLYRSVFDYSPFATGLALLPLALAMSVASILGPRLSDRLGTNRAIATGLAFVTLACLLLTRTSPTSSAIGVLVATFTLGWGFGLASVPSTASVVGAFPPSQVGVGSGLSSTTRQLGLLLGVAVLGSVLATVYRSDAASAAGRAQLGTEDAHAAAESVAGAVRISHGMGDAGVAFRHAAIEGFAHGFRAAAAVAAGLTAVAAVLVLRFLPSDRSRPVAPSTTQAALALTTPNFGEPT